MVDREKFRCDIIGILEAAGEKARRDPRLEREFAWIEKPLVFFIDYMVKEGRFPFREGWWELSRNYNELSGDEKFFDLLTETLNHPDCENSFILGKMLIVAKRADNIYPPKMVSHFDVFYFLSPQSIAVFAL
jgi:hypothetical protein